MRYLTAIFLCLPLFLSAQFRMIGTADDAWTVVDDSTYTVGVTFNNDLTGNSYLATQITTSFRMFTPTEQVYRISVAADLTFNTATLTVVEFGGDHGTPIGQLMVYNPDGNTSVPQAPFGSTGSTAQMQAAVDSYNARLIGSGGGGGDVSGPGSSIDNTVARFDATTGKIIQGSTATIDDTGNLGVDGNITVTGTVDGRDIASDGTKLDGVEIGATADQTDPEIETAYNNQVSVVDQQTAETGISTTVYRWTPERVKQAIDAIQLSDTTTILEDDTRYLANFAQLPDTLYVLGLGQSNMDGRNGTGGPTNILVYKLNGTEFLLATETGGNTPVIQFAKNVANTDSIIVKYIKVAQGGTSISEWFEGGTLLQALRDTIANLSYTDWPRVDVITWHQGESDADGIGINVGLSGSAADDNYISALDSVLSVFKQEYWWRDNTSFITGGLSTDTGATLDDRNGALETWSNKRLRSGFASAVGLSTDDGTHFTEGAVDTLGQRYYLSWLDIRNYSSVKTSLSIPVTTIDTVSIDTLFLNFEEYEVGQSVGADTVKLWNATNSVRFVGGSKRFRLDSEFAGDSTFIANTESNAFLDNYDGDLSMKFVLRIETADRPTFIINGLDNVSGYLVQFCSTNASVSNQIRFFRYNSGTQTALGSTVAYTLNEATDYTFKITFNKSASADTIRVYHYPADVETLVAERINTASRIPRGDFLFSTSYGGATTSTYIDSIELVADNLSVVQKDINTQSQLTFISSPEIKITQDNQGNLNITRTGKIKDSNGEFGTSGQYLSSTENGTDWVNGNASNNSITDSGNHYAGSTVEDALQQLGHENFIDPADGTVNITKYSNTIFIADAGGTHNLNTTNVAQGTRIVVFSDADGTTTLGIEGGDTGAFLALGTDTNSGTFSVSAQSTYEFIWFTTVWKQVK